MAPTVAVVVMGYRDETTIVAALESVLGQLEPGDDVVVVTSGPDSGCDRIRALHPDVPVVEVAGRLMPGGARNRGIAATSGEVVGFLAGDCLAEPGWVSAHRGAHADGHVAVSAAIVPAGATRPWSDASWLISYRNRLPGYPAGPVDPTSARRNGLSVDRSVLRELGGYDESLRIGEDTLLADRLLAAGHGIWFEPAARIAHPGPGRTVSLLRDEHRRGRLLREHRRRHGIPFGTRWPLRLWASITVAAITAGWRHGELPRWRVVTATPWIAAGMLSQLIGSRWERGSH